VSKQRKSLDQILGAFDGETAPPTTSSKAEEKMEASKNSLVAQLAKPSRKKSTIRFTLDLEKSLDDRLTTRASQLNRSKADLVRFAVDRLLKELDN
jgi:hypothetical protein